MPNVRVAVVGDTQRVLRIERIAFGRETNDAGRHQIARAILDDALDGIVHLGDLIGRASDWYRFDQDYPPNELSSKQFYVCRGNHDCGGLWFGSPDEFNRRYSSAVAGLQQFDVGTMRLLLVDTNEGAMSHEQWSARIDQYRAALDAAAAADAVKHVLVAGHHPPYTNARWHAPSQSVLDDFAQPFLRCTKSRLFFSGHVHGYERFIIDGRHFVVSGGGGGARFSHRHGDKRRLAGQVDLDDPHPLHYVLVEADSDVVTCTVRAISESNGEWIQLDQWHS